MHRLPLCIALTGGIASGKTAVADRFAAAGADVLDADVVARELVAPGSAALEEIVSTFGVGVLDPNHALDRRAMRERIFDDSSARAQLEAILHPRIREELHTRAMRTRAPYAMLVIPLLVESGRYDWVDYVLVVDVPRETQRARLITRDRIAAALADAMLAAQASREQRLAIADFIIDNAGPESELDDKVRALHRRFLELAETKRAGRTLPHPADPQQLV
jgi:dephospho-CoA kinase